MKSNSNQFKINRLQRPISMNKIIQWSINGASSQLAELENLSSQQQPMIICLQRCKLKYNKEFNLPGYIPYRLDPANYEDTGDVITLVDEMVPVVSQLKIVDSKLKAIAISVFLPSTHSTSITIVNIHCSSREPITRPEMQSLIAQLPKPFVLMGNFYEDNLIEMLLFSHPEISNLNEKDEPTHLDRSTGHFFVEDFTLATTDVSEKLIFNTYNDLCDSDHFPIILTLPHEPIHYSVSCPKWRTDDANWPLFTGQTEITTDHLADINEDIEFFTRVLRKAGYAAIPKSSPPMDKRRVGWWSPKITAAVRKRKGLLNELRNCRDRRNRNFIDKLFHYLRSCDNARKLIDSARKAHWDNLTASINQQESKPANWRKIQKIIGKTHNPPIRAIFEGNTLHTEPNVIADVLGSHYASVSSNASYSPEFLKRKISAEDTETDFFGDSDSNEYYNSPISMGELDYSLNNRNLHSTPGYDEIHPMMLNYLHESAKHYLLEIYNRIWIRGEFPPKWKLAMINPTLKKGKDKTQLGSYKDKTQPASYRPVALTSVLAKVFEKIVQKRLMWELEAKSFWCDRQYGFRKQRCTIQALGDLQLRVRKAFDKGAHLYTVFFDLQTASDTLWRHQILQHLHSIGIRGRMGHLIQNFLTNRKIMVRLGGSYSRTFDMENGLPQGSILCETLLLVALNDIQSAIKPPVDFALFVDDLVVSYESNSPAEAQQVIQRSIDDIIKWADDRGFKFSAEKTTCVDFHRQNSSEEPELSINGKQLNFSDTALYLGLTFDSSLSWTEHIRQLKELCIENLCIMKKIDNDQKGGDQTTLLRVYTSYIKTRLEYGSLAFGSASKKLLCDLDTIQNKAIQIATGAYPTSPASSLSAISGIFPLEVSRQLLSANFLANCLSIPNLPLNRLLFDSEGSLHQTSMEYLSYVTANFEQFLPDFCEFISKPPLPQIFSDPPPWMLKTPVVNLNLKEYYADSDSENPDDLPVEEIREKFASELSNYPDFTTCYTDGSKTEEQVGAAFSVSNVIRKFRLVKQCSSFTAELLAIFKCLEFLISYRSGSKFLVITDSMNALEALQDTYTYNPLLQRILLTHNTLVESDIEVNFMWIPSHVGIAGNEAIDRAARDASYKKKITCQMYTSMDVKSFLKSKILNSWQESYETQSPANQLVPIKPNPLSPASNPFNSKKENDILTRLRISHTVLTHSYLMNGRKPPTCPFCRNSRLLVEHILTNCPKLEKQRTKFNLPNSLHDLLNDSSPHFNNLFSFLDSLDLLHRI